MSRAETAAASRRQTPLQSQHPWSCCHHPLHGPSVRCGLKAHHHPCPRAASHQLGPSLQRAPLHYRQLQMIRPLSLWTNHKYINSAEQNNSSIFTNVSLLILSQFSCINHHDNIRMFVEASHNFSTPPTKTVTNRRRSEAGLLPPCPPPSPLHLL